VPLFAQPLLRREITEAESITVARHQIKKKEGESHNCGVLLFYLFTGK